MTLSGGRATMTQVQLRRETNSTKPIKNVMRPINVPLKTITALPDQREHTGRHHTNQSGYTADTHGCLDKLQSLLAIQITAKSSAASAHPVTVASSVLAHHALAFRASSTASIAQLVPVLTKLIFQSGTLQLRSW